MPPLTLGGARELRIKISSTAASADYHCWSKTVNGEWLFDNVAKDILGRHL